MTQGMPIWSLYGFTRVSVLRHVLQLTTDDSHRLSAECILARSDLPHPVTLSGFVSSTRERRPQGGPAAP